MRPILILYATREGHTRHVAEYLGRAILARGGSVDLAEAGQLPGGFSLGDYSSAILAASVHRSRHEPEMIEFAREHRDELEQIPSAFLSVSLSEAGVENQRASPESRAEAAGDAHRMIEDFLEETGWRPARIQAVAGALLYSQYNFVLRFVMKRIARSAGGDTDTTRDYVYTDWQELDELIDDLMMLEPVAVPVAARR